MNAPSRLLQCVALAAVVALAACSKKPGHRSQVVECSSISLDAKGTTQCLVGLYHWRAADAQKAATDRARELDSLKNYLLVAGWPLSRVNAAQESIWNGELPQHRRELQTCMTKRDFNLSSCLTLYYKWDSDRALATADSVTRARLGGAR